MIELFPNTTPKKTLKRIQKAFRTPTEAEAEIEHIAAHFLEEDLRNPLIYEIENAVTSDGTLYQKVEFRVTTRYTNANGDHYIAGDTFIVNFSEQLRELASILKDWRQTK